MTRRCRWFGSDWDAIPLLLVAVILPGGFRLNASAPIDLDSLRAHSVRTWSKQDGLPAHAATTLAQTPDGYLWVATDEGLVRFDGKRFVLFDRESVPELTDNRILSLDADETGVLWIGTEGGLASFHHGAFRRHAVSSDAVVALMSSSRGVLWVGTRGGLFRSKDRGIFERIAAPPLSGAQIRALSEDATGRVWVGTSDAGLFRCDGASCERVGASNITAVRALSPAGKSGMWVGTQAAGLFRVSGGAIERWTTRDGLPNDSVYALLEASDDSLWIGTNGGGIGRIRAGEFESPPKSGPRVVRSFLEDREGNMWAASVDSGINRLTRAQFTVLQTADGLAADVILPVHEAANGDLWVGTAGKGINRLHGGRWLHYDTSDGLRHNLILTVHSDPRGDVWIGTAGGGLTRFRDGRFETFTTADGLSSDLVSAVLPARDGSLWIGTTDGGLHHMVGERISRVKAWPLRNSILCMLESSDGKLWVGTEGAGLAHVSGGKVTIFRKSDGGLQGDTINGLVEDATRAVWIGTSEGGLSRWKDGRLTTITKAHGLREDLVQQLLDDGRGSLWLGGNHGISRVALEEAHAVADGIRSRRIHPRVFGIGDGLATDETNGGIFPSAWRARSGLLYFPTMGGLAVTDPRAKSRSIAVRPLIENVRARGRTLLSTTAAIRIPPRTDRVEITYSAPVFTDPESTVYRYRLDGFDSAWVYAEGRQIAQYTRIPAGTYTFRVSARTRGGRWSESDAVLPLRVLPAFFETTAFRAIAVIAVFLVIWGLHRWRTEALRRRHDTLELLIEERSVAVEALHRSEAHFRMLIEHASDLVMIVSDQGTISYVSPSAERILGRPPGGLIGMNLRSLVRPEDAIALDRTVFGILESDHTAAAFVRIPSSDSPDRHLELVAQRLKFGGDGDRLLINCRDITQRKMLEQRLEQANRIASLGRLAATIAHEFNNVLMGINAMAEVLRRIDAPPVRIRELAQKIADSVARGKRITDDVLRYARDSEPVVAAVDLATWVPHLRDELRNVAGDHLDIQTFIAEPLTIAADAEQLMQLFINMVLNARDAMPGGGTVNLSFTRASEEDLRALGYTSGSYVHIQVADEGEGIPSAVIPHIFEPLFTTKRATGTGIGLAVVYQIVTRHGGYIGVASEPGRGTTFHIFLPACASVSVETVEPEAVSAPRSHLRILLVEDDPLVAEGLQMNLEFMGAEVRVATTGCQALEDLSHWASDAVLLDVGLPDMDGTLVFEEISRIAPDLPVIFSTGHADAAMLDVYADRKNVGFIRKPYDVTDVLTLLRTLMPATAEQRAEQATKRS